MRALKHRVSLVTLPRLPSHDPILLTPLLRPNGTLLARLRSHLGAVGSVGSMGLLLLLLLLLLPNLALAVGFVGVQVRGGERDGGGGTAKHAVAVMALAEVVWVGLPR